MTIFEELLEVRAFDAPAGLATQQCAAQLPGLEPAAHGLGVHLKLGRNLIKGKETLSSHHHNGISVALRRFMWHVYGDKSSQE